MPRHVEIFIDSVPLSSVGPFIVSQVYEDAPPMEIMEGERPGRHGTLLLDVKRQSLKVAVEVLIRDLFDLASRSRHQENLAAWAHGLLTGQTGGHELRLSSHPERILRVVCTADPALGPVRDATAAARVEFTAAPVPFWESAIPSRWFTSGASEDSSLILPGTAPVPVLLDVTPTSGTLTSFTVSLGGNEIALTGLSVPQGTPLIFSRDPFDNLLISAAGASQLSKRSAESADDLIANPGQAAFEFSANTAVDVSLRCYARWR